MKKAVFETNIGWQTGERFTARIEVGADGWGRVFDTTDGLYCGSINPIRVRQLMREAKGHV